jgi:ribosomal protein S18 acetylase RimI-like enzyme
MDATLRPITAADDAFLLALYVSVRAPEFAVLGMPEAQMTAFLAGQYRLQSHHYATHYDTSRFAIVTVDKQPAGRLLADYGQEVRIVDISLLPAFRGKGLGTALLETVIAEAGATKCAVSLHVEASNPARRLYERLGFLDTGERHGPYIGMRRAAPAGDS